VNVEPASAVASAESAVAPALVDTEKSEVSPTAGPKLLRTVIVQSTTSTTRTTVVLVLTCPVHERIDETGAIGNMTKGNAEPPDITLPEVSSVIKNKDVVVLGAVTVKLNVAPPLPVVCVAAPDPSGPYDVVKSVERPMALPVASLTVTIHDMTSLTRA
jgi:hypothetical protein